MSKIKNETARHTISFLQSVFHLIELPLSIHCLSLASLIPVYSLKAQVGPISTSLIAL